MEMKIKGFSELVVINWVKELESGWNSMIQPRVGQKALKNPWISNRDQITPSDGIFMFFADSKHLFFLAFVD